MKAEHERGERPRPERTEGIRAFRGIMIGVGASFALFWAPLVVALVLVSR